MLQNLINTVRELITVQEIANETTLEDWMTEGDTDGMTAQEIANEWDEMSATANDQRNG